MDQRLIDAIELGNNYQASLSENTRRSGGVHYTPIDMCEYVTKNALQPVLDTCKSVEDVLSIQVCDPACGSGAFLIMSCYVIEQYINDVFPSDIENLRSVIASSCLNGVDIDSKALSVCHDAMRLFCDDDSVDIGLYCCDFLDGNIGLPIIDCFIGNPPFMGGGRISGTFGDDYLKMLKRNFKPAHGNSDLCAYFFRRAGELVSAGGTIAFVATNTISQGDTRFTGLKHLVNNGFEIYFADTNMKWGGTAAVTVSIVGLIRVS